MNKNLIPKFLESYNVFDRLNEWLSSGAKEQQRVWSLGNHLINSKWGVRCTITWRFGDNQLGGINKVAFSAQEAVYLCLEEFKKWERTK